MQSDIGSLFPTIYRGVLETDALSQALDVLFNGFFTELDRALNNQFIKTSDEVGLSALEAILGIRPADGDTLEERRDRISMEWRSRLPYTYRSLEAYLSDVTQGFEMDLDHNAYTLALRVILTGVRQRDALIDALRKMLPANLVLSLFAAILQDLPPTRLTAISAMRTTVIHNHIPLGG